MGLVLFLTNRCNLKCKYCFVNKNQEDMSLDTYIKAIKDYKNVTQNVTFFGGEPLLCFNRIKEIVAYNKKNSIKVKYNLNTNALLLENDILNYCLDNNFLLNVSLDGNKKSNLINRCNEEQFNHILTNIKTAIKRGGNVIVNYVITPNNLNLYYDGIKFLIDNNINNICLMIDYEAKWLKKDIDLFKKEHDRVVSLLVKTDEYIKLYPFSSKVQAIVNKQEVKKCNFGKENIIVSTKGKYYPCMNFIDNEDYLITEINQSFENTVDIKKCLNCKYLPYCSNNCMCKNKKQNKESEIDVNCEIEKIFVRSATDYIINKIDNII